MLVEVRTRSHPVVLSAFLVAAAALALLLTAVSADAKRVAALDIGVDDGTFTNSQLAADAVAKAQGISARYARVTINWALVAPGGSDRPAGFDARNPADPAYRWARYDNAVQRLTMAGLRVYVSVLGTPKWAQQGAPQPNDHAGGGAWRPSPADYGDFAHAAALRYSGVFTDPASGTLLPRVSIWQAWNEPNLPLFLAPTNVELYRSLLNTFYNEVKRVQRGALVATAGLAPVKSSMTAAFPKTFARQLLCIRRKRGWYVRTRSCTRARFDIFAVHPYSLKARPGQRASINGNMFVADVADVTQMVRAAVRLKSVHPARSKRLWSTEFAWFTNPPNESIGDRPTIAARSTNAALYSMWRAGLRQITWFAVSDNTEAIVEGGGFHYADGRAKPTRTALRFPFYAAQRARRAYIWGRAPQGRRARVFVQQRTRRGWRTVLRIRPQADGMFVKRLRVRTRSRGAYRARQAGVTTVAMPASGQGVSPL